MSWDLWLDDQFDEPDMIFRHPTQGFIPARSSDEAKKLVQEKGIPSFISFDHDLGNGDDAMIFVNWLIENYYESSVPGYRIHSANPVGTANIISKIESWRKSKLI